MSGELWQMARNGTTLLPGEARKLANAYDKLREERDTLRLRLEVATRDTERLNVLADEPIFEEFGYTGLNIYAVSSIIAKENGRDKPNKDDQRQAFRHLMDASSAMPWSPDDE